MLSPSQAARPTLSKFSQIFHFNPLFLIVKLFTRFGLTITGSRRPHSALGVKDCPSVKPAGESAGPPQGPPNRTHALLSALALAPFSGNLGQIPTRDPRPDRKSIQCKTPMTLSSLAVASWVPQPPVFYLKIQILTAPFWLSSATRAMNSPPPPTPIPVCGSSFQQG